MLFGNWHQTFHVVQQFKSASASYILGHHRIMNYAVCSDLAASIWVNIKIFVVCKDNVLYFIFT